MRWSSFLKVFRIEVAEAGGLPGGGVDTSGEAEWVVGAGDNLAVDGEGSCEGRASRCGFFAAEVFANNYKNAKRVGAFSEMVKAVFEATRKVESGAGERLPPPSHTIPRAAPRAVPIRLFHPPRLRCPSLRRQA